MERNRHTQPAADADKPEYSGEPLSQEGLLTMVLAAIRETRPDKCVVLEARHLPEECPGFASQPN
jgi:hypothetical protein